MSALVEQAYAPWVPVVGGRPAPMDDDYDARISAGQCWVAIDDPERGQAGGIAAVSVLERHPDHVLLDNVAVAPACQGRRLGSVLIAHAIGVAAGLGLPELRLYTNEKMERNIAMYRHIGFVETGRAAVGPRTRVFMTLRVQ